MTQVPPARYLQRAKDLVDASMPPAAIYARVPSCILRRDTRRPADSRVKTARGEKTNGSSRP